MAVVPIVLVEDDDRYVQAVKDALQPSARYDVVACFRSVQECRQTQVHPGSIWLVDLGLPDGMSGLDLIAPLVALGAKPLVMTVFEDETRVVNAIQAGAHGYYVKGDGNLLAAITEVDEGMAPLSPKIATHLLKLLRQQGGESSPRTIFLDELSPRELETLQALAHGYSYREVAHRHRVSHHTVGDHVKSIYRKLQVNSKTAAIKVALKRGILSLDEV